METPPNNAMRLRAILDKIKKCAQNTSVKEAIKHVFALKNDSDVGIWIGNLFDLANTTVKQISSIPDIDPTLHLAWQPAVYDALSSLSVNGNINRLREVYTDVVSAHLHASSYKLGQSFPDIDIPKDTLEKIYDEIGPIIDSLVADEGLDPKLKRYIIDRLESIREIITHKDLMGYDKLIPIVESTFAGTFFRLSNNGFTKLKVENCSVAAFIDWLGRLLIIIETAQIGSTGIKAAVEHLLLK